MGDYLAGIDLGTSVCKCAIYDHNLKVISDASAKCRLNKISASEIEQDPEDWWESVCRTLKSAMGKAGIGGSEVKALAISSQGIAFVPADENGTPLRPAISWLDSRAAAENAEIEAEFGVSRIFAMTGKRTSAYYTLPKILWLRRHEPEIFRKTKHILTAHDYLAARLCCRFFTDHTLASGTSVYNIVKRDWDSEILQRFGLERQLFPEILQSGTIAGRICPKAAGETGLGTQTVIVAGGQDQKCAALGAGVGAGLGWDEAAVSLGTATAVIKLCPAAVIDPSMTAACFAGLGEGEWVLESALATSCASLNWLKDTILSGFSNEKLDRIAADTYGPPNPVRFYPFLTPAADGDENAMLGSFMGISLSTGISDLVKSVYEGVAFQIKNLVNKIQEIGGPVQALRIYGGGAASDIWCTMIADITGKKLIRLKDRETACRGAAMLAGSGAGAFDMLAVMREPHDCDSFYPDENMKKQYQDLDQEYFEIQNKFRK
jgi:xylulokinase